MKYKNPKLSIPERVEDLISQMTIEEKVAQLSCILPTMLLGDTIPDPDLCAKYMANGLGRITQFGSTAWDSPLEITKLANGIQAWIAENTRLKIPVLFQIEATNGLLAVDATIFPSPINMANTWDPELVYEAACAVRYQMRAIGARKALSPVFDLAQDSRWGRIDETYGEDPYLSATIGGAYVHGIQTDNIKEGAAACGKHFLGYSRTQGGLNKAEVNLSDRDIYEYFAFPFEAAIHEYDLKSIMCTYSSINGVPASINKGIMRKLLREKMGFNGVLLCDGGSIEMVQTFQHTSETLLEAGILVIEAGLDADTPVTEAFSGFPQAIRQGRLDIQLVNEAVNRNLTLKFELGLFENPFVDESSINCAFSESEKGNSTLALKLAEESIVLLKNENSLLPIKNDHRKIALIGPHMDSIRSCFPGFSMPSALEMYKVIFEDLQSDLTMGGIADAEIKVQEEKREEQAKGFGNFVDSFKTLANKMDGFDPDAFTREHYGVISLREAIMAEGLEDTEFFYAAGCNINDNDRNGFEEAVQAAEKSDLVILSLGDGSGWTEGTAGEGHDSTSLQLPGIQNELLQAVHKTGTPIVLIIFGARPHAINWAVKHIPVIIDAWYPGQRAQTAIARTLFGKNNPSGHLSLTIPRSVGQVPIYYNHRIGSGYYNPFTQEILKRSAPFNGYYNEEATPLFPFGYGLSYTSFKYTNFQISPIQPKIDQKVKISCKVKNKGQYNGSEVVQLYTFDREAHVTRPVKRLMGFARVHILKGEMKTITFTVDISQLAFLDMDMNLVIEPGNIDVMIGSNSEDIRLSGSFEIMGNKKVLQRRNKFFTEVEIAN